MIEYTRSANDYETDANGYVHHSNYIRYMEEARIYALEKIGFSFKALEEQGLASPVVDVKCEYIGDLDFEDRFTVGVWGYMKSSAVFELKYEITLDGEEIANGSSKHCFMKGGRPINIKKELPEFVSALENTKKEK